MSASGSKTVPRRPAASGSRSTSTRRVSSSSSPRARRSPQSIPMRGAAFCAGDATVLARCVATCDNTPRKSRSPGLAGGSVIVLEGARFRGADGRSRAIPLQATASAIISGRAGCASRGDGALAAQDSVLVQIARPYAQALFDIAQGDKSLDVVEQGLVSIADMATESGDFSRFLRSPVISAEAKSGAVAA
ncbi:MAG: hypothetical protein EOP19_13090, partial [Hyphomicrobiales bacterium]